jgi:predicted nucleic acid-binding protein
MFLVDSDVLVHHLRGDEVARAWLRNARSAGPLSTSAVSVAEIRGGMRSAERRSVETLLGILRVEPVTEEVAHHAGDLRRRFRRSHVGVGIADYLIAATASVTGLELATLNVRHFPMFPDLAPAFRR